MRIVKRKEFLSMPYGTVFSKFKDDDSSKLYVKCSEPNEYSNDYCLFPVGSLEFTDEFCWDCNTRDNLINNMMKDSSVSYQMDECSSMRDGLYNTEEVYVIYEKEDIKKMIQTLIDCL